MGTGRELLSCAAYQRARLAVFENPRFSFGPSLQCFLLFLLNSLLFLGVHPLQVQ